MVLFCSGCPSQTTTQAPGSASSGHPLCPGPGKVVAKRLAAGDPTFRGAVAVGGAGDGLLINDQAAFVITQPGSQSTYYEYGGIVADAVPLSACKQSADDKLEELGFGVGRVNLDDPWSSVLRFFKAEKMVLVNGGPGEAAIIRVSGVDARAWLVDHTLTSRAADSGSRRPLSQSMGVAIEIDYILAPDSAVLEIVMRVETELDDAPGVLGAATMTFGPTLELRRWFGSPLDFAGYTARLHVPWLSATDGAGAYALSMPGGDMSHLQVEGISAVFDSRHILGQPLALDDPDTEAQMRFAFSVGARDANSAVRGLHAVDPEPLFGQKYFPVPIRGRVFDDRGPVANATVELESTGDGVDWRVLDAFVTTEDGAFQGEIPEFGVATPWPMRLVTKGEGRPAGRPTTLDMRPSMSIDLQAPPSSLLKFDVKDQDGAPSSGRLALRRSDGYRSVHMVRGVGAVKEEPGLYSFVLSRGFEYKPVSGTVELPPGGQGELRESLEHVVDTRGFVSFDSHVHSAPSPDSQVLPELRIQNAAAHGLEIVVATEHEIVVGLEEAVKSTGLTGIVNTIIGEEVTAPVPEHMSVFPLVPDGTPRGGPVQWRGRDLPEIVEASRRRGGDIVILNHPEYLELIQWDGLVGAPKLQDPALYGLPEGADLWTWDLDAIEVMNGMKDPFSGAGGYFDEWQSFLNHGHPIFAVGVSDTHGLDDLGFPRTYIASESDDPADFSPEEMVAAFRRGQMVLSAGAFARIRAVGSNKTAIGAELRAVDGVLPLSVHIEALPTIDVTHFVVFANCSTVLSVRAPEPHAVKKFSGTVAVPIGEDAHLTIAGFGANALPDGFPTAGSEVPRFLTNPIWVDGNGDGVYTPPGGRTCAIDLEPPGSD